MATASVRNLIDQLARDRAEQQRRLGTAARGASRADPPSGLRYAAGDRVLDLTTGLEGTVDAGERDPRTRWERYQVRLADARVVFRSEKELERRLPAPH